MNIPSYIKARGGNVELSLHCQPRAAKTEIVGLHGDALKIRLAAPPVEGQANRVLCKFFAGYFGVSQEDFQFLSGKGAKQKRVLIKGKDGSRNSGSSPFFPRIDVFWGVPVRPPRQAGQQGLARLPGIFSRHLTFGLQASKALL